MWTPPAGGAVQKHVYTQWGREAGAEAEAVAEGDTYSGHLQALGLAWLGLARPDWLSMMSY